MVHDAERRGNADFAAALRELKDRTPYSFEALAARCGVSRSALHRYCAGRTVPGQFAVVERFARQCRASREELVELHRLWTLAGAPPAPRHPIAAAPVPAPRRRLPHCRLPRPASAAVAGLLAALVAMLLALLAGLWWYDDGRPADPSDAGMPLFASPCAGPVALGRADDCVLEVQRLLAAAGAELAASGSFGPETLRRVEAFQIFAGLPSDGVVDDATKRALYAGEITLSTWSPEQVAERIREVFAEDPGTAVRIARCQSFMDPLHILPNSGRTRSWGVFQLSDARLPALGGSPRDALDPEWNIQAGYRLWSARRDFSAWPNCLAAIDDDGLAPPEEPH